MYYMCVCACVYAHVYPKQIKKSTLPQTTAFLPAFSGNKGQWSHIKGIHLIRQTLVKRKQVLRCMDLTLCWECLFPWPSRANTMGPGFPALCISLWWGAEL